MLPLTLPQTQSTPLINLEKEKNIFVIRGTSLPENCNSFYQPVIDWFEEYFKDPNGKTNIEFWFDYLNTSSSKMINNILRIFELQSKKGLNVSVTWKYQVEDSDILEFAEEMKQFLQVPIEIEPMD